MDHANNVVNSFIYKLVCTSFNVHFLYFAIWLLWLSWFIAASLSCGWSFGLAISWSLCVIMDWNGLCISFPWVINGFIQRNGTIDFINWGASLGGWICLEAFTKAQVDYVTKNYPQIENVWLSIWINQAQVYVRNWISER